MIDLRSDTLTMPDEAMLRTILTAPLGDDGRLGADGRGEDPTINRLEDMAAELTGKEAGLLCCSGTMGNQTALMTWCQPGDKVMVDPLQHLYRSEKTAFDSRYTRLEPLFYQLDEAGMPDPLSVGSCLSEGAKLLCVENTHNFAGGTCITTERLAELRALAREHHIAIHMDGARLFNAAAFLGVPVRELCQYADSVMFCLSKGLAAPVGSVLCGSREFIAKAKGVRKLLGGALRQGGIIAAPGIYALEHNVERISEDNANAARCAARLKDLKVVRLQKHVQTNILMLDLRDAGVTPETFCQMALEEGLWIRPVLDTSVRLVFYKGITAEDAEAAADVICRLDAACERRPS